MDTHERTKRVAVQNIIVKRSLSDDELEDLSPMLVKYFIQHIIFDEYGWNVVLVARRATRELVQTPKSKVEPEEKECYIVEVAHSLFSGENKCGVHGNGLFGGAAIGCQFSTEDLAYKTGEE